MTTIAWLVAGFALLGLSGLLESLGDTGASPGARLPLYLPALAALVGAPYCFFRSIRSAIAGIIGVKPDKARDAAPDAAPPRPARRIADSPETPAFDADAVFARYMEKRAAAPPDEADRTPAGPAQTNPRPRRPSFGRRGV